MLRHKRTCPGCGGSLARIRSQPAKPGETLKILSVLLTPFEWRLYECSSCGKVCKTSEVLVLAGDFAEDAKRYLPETEPLKDRARDKTDGGPDED